MKKNIFFFAVLMLLLSGGASAQMHRYNTNFSVAPQKLSDTIHIEFSDNQIYLPVGIMGRTYRFCLDTGSSQGMLYAGSNVPVYKTLGSVISHDANNTADTIDAVQLPPMAIGRREITGYVASVVKAPRGKVPYDGIIGFDIFNKGLACKIDTRKKIMILTDIKGQMDAETGYTLKYKLKWFAPFVNVSPFMRHVDETLFDTGARQLYVMNHTSFLEHSYKSKQVSAQVEGRATGNMYEGTNGAEKNSEVVFLHLDRLKYGEFSFNDVHTITTQGSSRLGAQMLGYGAVVINPRRKSITFEPYDGTDSISVNNRQFGIAFYDKDGQSAIGLIWHKTEGYRNGMRQGDVVLRINGKTISSYDDFVNYKFRDGEKYTFIMHDQRGFNKEITITR